MATMRDWERDLGKKSDIELLEIYQALKVLNKWPMFSREFSIHIIQVAVKIAIDNLGRRLR